MSKADDKARDAIDLTNCAKINLENLEKKLPTLARDPHYRIAKHQLDCAAAIFNGEPEPEFKP